MDIVEQKKQRNSLLMTGVAEGMKNRIPKTIGISWQDGNAV